MKRNVFSDDFKEQYIIFCDNQDGCEKCPVTEYCEQLRECSIHNYYEYYIHNS